MSDFAYGADLGWLSQLETEGYRWTDEEGTEADPLILLKRLGVNSVRLRIFVNPPKNAYWQKRPGERVMLGYCDAESVVRMAERAKKSGMRVMLDFHYSDHFADPEFQDIPEAWAGEESAALAERVYAHTKDVLVKIRNADIRPEWVQVGNEINPGMLLPFGSIEDYPEALTHMLNRGYEAVKEVFPESKVITHLAEFTDTERCHRFFDRFFAHGGKTDILGFSNYPYWYGKENYVHSLEDYFREYSERYGKPVMVVETGEEDRRPKETYKLLLENIRALKNLPDGEGLGAFYWEPEACRDILPDGYALGASRLTAPKTLRFTSALTAFRDSCNL